MTTGSHGEAGSWAVEGIGEDFIPPIADLSAVRRAYSITDEESFATARELLRAEGILGGSSTGTLLAAALRYCREQTSPKRVATFVCDTGTRYLSKVYNDQWMLDQGLLKRPRLDDLRDLISRRHDEGSVVSVGPQDTLLTAFQRMRLADVSQLPVLDGERLAGVIDESDLLIKVHDDPALFRSPVESAMTTKLQTLAPAASLQQLEDVLDRGLVAIIADERALLRTDHPRRLAEPFAPAAGMTQRQPRGTAVDSVARGFGTTRSSAGRAVAGGSRCTA